MKANSFARWSSGFGLALLLVAGAASAAEVRVMISAGFYGVYAELGPAFERASGHRLVTTRGPSMGDSPEAIPTRLARGESADVVILDGAAADELVKRGVARAGSKVELARSMVGMVVREGAAKPDIGSVDAFRRTLLAAKSIAYSDSGSGTYLATTLFPRLGVADQVAGKSRKVRGPPSGEPVAAVVARGEAEIGFQQVSELVHVAGVTYVGPLPAELQPGFSFAGAITANAREPVAGAALIRFLASAEAAPVITKAGLAPFAMNSAALNQQPGPIPAGPPQPTIVWDAIEIKTIYLGNRTYMLVGQGGNITIAAGDDAIIMVDGQFAQLSDKIKAAIRAISPLPVKYLVNTHFHGDHTGGNENFAKDGATIVAHDNIRVRLAAGTQNMMTGVKAPPRPAEALPKQTYYGGSFDLEAGGRKARLTHASNAHTDGDTWVFFADANVLCTGDTFNNLKKYQNIDFANGGDVRGMIRAVDAYLKIADDRTKIVPGHGGLATKADLATFRNMLVASHDRIKKLYDEGKTEAEVLALRPLADLDATWSNGPSHAAGHLRNVYHSFGRF